MDVNCEGVTLKDVWRACSLHNLPEGGTLQSMFLSHGAVMCLSKELASVGDFVLIKVSIIILFLLGHSNEIHCFPLNGRVDSLSLFIIFE